MSGKYEPLRRALMDAARRGQQTVEFDFQAMDELVGGLPASAVARHWWANTSRSQALAWQEAGYRVEQVYLDRKRVRFARTERRDGFPGHASPPLPVPRQTTDTARQIPVGRPVDLRISLQWYACGQVTLDGAGKPVFESLEAVPGLYRIALSGGVRCDRSRVYIGETDNLRRRLAGNYRNPGPSQQTSLRINRLLREHLAAGGTVDLAVTTAVTIWLSGVERTLDLTRKAARLLAENAALVSAQTTAEAEIVNLG